MNCGMVLIEVYSDVICPWCYVGKRRLEIALARLDGSVPLEVAWRPFELNPMMPLEGMERTAYLEAKFGSRGAYRQLEAQVLGAGVQINFAFDKILVTPNTFGAHRLIWYSAGFGKQEAMVEALFLAFFVEGKDVGRAAILAEAAVRAGLNEGDVARFLDSDEGVEDVKSEEAAGLRAGIRVVPTFVLNGTYTLSGAQPVEVLIDAIVGARAREEVGV